LKSSHSLKWTPAETRTAAAVISRTIMRFLSDPGPLQALTW
jgi:hypothetical protein